MDIRNADIRPIDGLMVEDNGNYSVTYECWFDADKYFGTCTRNNPDVWVNFYTEWNPQTGRVTPVVHIDAPEGISVVEKEFSPEEEKFFLDLMQSYAREQYGKSLEEIYQEDRKGEKYGKIKKIYALNRGNSDTE